MTGLARRTLGTPALVVYALGASSPLTVLAGGIPAMYGSGVAGVPWAFMVVAAVVVLLAVGYVALGRHVPHTAPFYAQLAQGLSPAVGMAGALVALVGYHAIQISLYGLIAVTLVGLFGGVWWAWAAVVWAVLAVLGRLPGASNARVLGGLLAVELAVIALFDVAALGSGDLAQVGLSPQTLLVPGASGVLAFAMAAFVGTELPPAFAEEARERAAGRATLTAICCAGGFYTVAAVAVAATGAADPLAALGAVFGPGVAALATLLLVTSILAAMAAFHAAAARYVFALARERVLPGMLARVSRRGGAPLGGSVTQSTVAGIVVAGFVAAGADPVTGLFTWLSTIGAVAIIVLLTASSLAAVRFFAAGRGGAESVWVRQVIPGVAAVFGVLLTAIMLGNLGAFLGIAPGSLLPWLVPVVIAAAALLGALWAGWLRGFRPHIYRQISRGAPDPLTTVDARLAQVEV